MSALLEATDLRKRYPGGRQHAVGGVSLALRAGEMVAVIGPSGAGKSTLFKLLARLTALDTGQVRFAGRDLYGLGQRQFRQVRRQIGLVFQAHNLIPQLPVALNVLAGDLGEWRPLRALRGLVWGLTDAERHRASRALAAVGLADRLDERAGELSGGQQQRVAIARLLVQDPRLVLADEPVASVDPATALGLMDLFRELNRRHGKTVLVNLHQVALARRYFARIVGLQGGRVVFDGSPAELDETRLRDIYGPEAERMLSRGLDEALPSAAITEPNIACDPYHRQEVHQ